MKQPKKLTRLMKIKLSRMDLEPNDWQYTRVTTRYLVIIHKHTGERKVLENG